MPITLSEEEFNEFTKYTRPERLEAFLMQHYKNHRFEINPEIIKCPYVTKNMVGKLFVEFFPRSEDLMEVFLSKCSAAELISELISKAAFEGKCWDERVAKESPRDQVISKTLSKTFENTHSYWCLDTLKAFLNSTIVNAEDIKFLITSYWNTDRGGIDKI